MLRQRDKAEAEDRPFEGWFLPLLGVDYDVLMYGEVASGECYRQCITNGVPPYRWCLKLKSGHGDRYLAQAAWEDHYRLHGFGLPSMRWTHWCRECPESQGEYEDTMITLAARLTPGLTRTQQKDPAEYRGAATALNRRTRPLP